MFKITKKIKKILTTILLSIILFSNIQPVVLAANETLSGSGSGRFMARQYATKIKTTDSGSNTENGIIARRLILRDEGWNFNNGDGIIVFCAQNGVPFATGQDYNGNYSAPSSAELKKASKIAYFGWYQKHGTYGSNGVLEDNILKDYAYTQQYIWESLGQSHGTFVNPVNQSEYEQYKNEIENKIQKMTQRVSFDGTSIPVEVGETKTLEDTNGVLSDYNTVDVTRDNIRFEHNKGENTLKITVNEGCSVENFKFTDALAQEVGLIKGDTENKGTTIYIGFVEGTQDQLYSLNYNDPVTLAFELTVKALGSLELTKLNTNGDLVDGAVFTVTGPDGYNEDVTVSGGKIKVENLKSGVYQVKEKSVGTGYLINTENYSVTVEAGQTATQAIVNKEPTGTLKLIKTDIDTGNSNRIDGTSHHGDATLDGTVFALYAKEDIYNVARTVKYFNTDEQIATFTFNEYGVANIKITNTSTPANISVSGDTLTGLPMGKYYCKETTVSEGYTRNDKTYTLDFKYKNSTTAVIEVNETLTNTVQKAPFEVIKVTTNDNTTAEVVGGAEFTAILTKYVDYYGSFEEAKKHLSEFAEDEYSVFTTGSNGHGVSGLLAYGNYTVNETYTPSPEIETVEEFYVTIDKDSKTPVRELVENDLPFEAYLRLEKKDKESGKFVVLSNATFELYKLNEETSEWEKVKCKVGNQYFDTWTTDNEGVARTETKVEAGTFKLSEIKIPNGFIQLDEELIFKVNNANPTLNYDEDWDAWITVTAENSQPKGKLELTKTVKLRENVDKSVIKDIDYTKISFELIAKEDIIDYTDGSVIYSAGQTVGKYNLNEDATLTLDNIWMGKYILKELTTIEGAALDNTEYDVIFTQTDTTTKEYTVELNIENKTTLVELSKKDITGDKELEGAELTVLDEEGNIIDSWVSTSKPHTIEGLEVRKGIYFKRRFVSVRICKSNQYKI